VVIVIIKDRENDSEYLRVVGLTGYILNLVLEINNAITKELYLYVEILSRKLLENLVINILLKSLGPTAVWENSDSNVRQNLSKLLKTFWSFVDNDFKKYCVTFSREDLKTLQDVSWAIKKLGDSGVHTVKLEASKESVMARQNDLQNLVDFLIGLERIVPNENKSLELSKPVSEIFPNGYVSWNISYPRHFPSKALAKKESTGLYYFTINCEVQNQIADTLRCQLYFQSEHQAVGFQFEAPKRRFDWRHLKWIEDDKSLNIVEEDYIGPKQKSLFVINGFLRPGRLLANQRKLTLKYRILARSESGIFRIRGVDSKLRLLIIPIINEFPSENSYDSEENKNNSI
jgi:hypothetical protein